MTTAYDRYVLPYLIDVACGMKAIQHQRGELVSQARGRVLEIGIGTGRNLPFYDKAKLESLCGLDPAAQMHSLARKRARRAQLDVELLTLPAEWIPADDASFDTVLSTFTLCTIPDAVAALREMRRVLKPDGVLLFCEHGLAPDADVRRWQDRLTPVWKPIAGGCHLNRDIPALLAAGGFETITIEADYLKGPRPMTYVYRGSARRAAPQ
ncbi:class I SAM-dependent methyltransferase [Solimonas terrae]|uniref:Class I SAM-dependent methyltransferase n=1 Tax=Solimonas terrae TaxID=1396819 RepID=A0A6M2BX23_9GAMM|nr:class I SAM-dependent methyltransferase [Solimonas terrae]NGY06693.1 class I SAM-dependent methyltransferase [Solimonas terrae]